MFPVDQRLWTLFKRHWRHTLTYWSVFFSFGQCLAFLGPTVLDLRCQTRSTLEQITWVFFSQQFFLLVGSALGGLCKRTLRFSLSTLCFCTLIISLVFAVIPLCHDVIGLSVTLAIAGLAMGVIDTIANLQLVNLYQRDSAVFLQALHVFIGLGALVSPLVVDPFLSDGNCILGTNWTANSSSSSSSSDLHHLRNYLGGRGMVPHNISHDLLHTEGTVITRVSYAFWIMALTNLPAPVAVLVLMYQERMLPCFSPGTRLIDGDSLSSENPSGSGGNDHGVWSGCFNPAKLRGRPATFFILHILGGAILFMTDGIIGSYSGFVFTFAMSPPLSMGHKMASSLNSVFWASITVGRLAFIYLSYRYTATNLLILSLMGVILVQCLLLIFYYSCVFLFIGTCVLALCISSVYPCMLAFTEDILDYKGCATTVLVTSASTGEMVLQVLMGSVINTQGSYAFPLCGTAASFISFSLFLLLLYVQHLHRNQTGRNTAANATTGTAIQGDSHPGGQPPGGQPSRGRATQGDSHHGDSHPQGQPSRGTAIQGDSHPQGQPSRGTAIHRDSHPGGQPSTGTAIQGDSHPGGQPSTGTAIQGDSHPGGQPPLGQPCRGTATTGTAIQGDSHPLRQPSTGTATQGDSHPLGQPSTGTAIQRDSHPQGQPSRGTATTGTAIQGDSHHWDSHPGGQPPLEQPSRGTATTGTAIHRDSHPGGQPSRGTATSQLQKRKTT
ncbi:major facilitator superfamily domain-containing protein 4A [Diretmus argenteus]